MVRQEGINWSMCLNWHISYVCVTCRDDSHLRGHRKVRGRLNSLAEIHGIYCNVYAWGWGGGGGGG